MSDLIQDALPLMEQLNPMQANVAKKHGIPMFKGILYENITDDYGNTILKKVNENKLPEVDDGFAKKVGPFKTVQAMREDVRAQLSMQKQKEADDRLKDELVGMLVEKSTIPVPQVLVDDQMKQIEQDATQNLMYQGMNPEQYMAQQGCMTGRQRGRSHGAANLVNCIYLVI